MMAGQKYKLAHMTDIHLPIPERPEAGDLFNKRILGYLSWVRKRSKAHQQWACDLLADDLTRQDCNALLITGDLVNIGLPAEFAAGRRWLDERFADLPVIYTPGNHDTYARARWAATLGRLGPYMSGARLDDDAMRPPDGFADFPFRVELDGAPVTIIAANSSPTTPPGSAAGAVGKNQRTRLKTMLDQAEERNHFTILMLHHPVNEKVVSRRKALIDRKPLCDDLSSAGLDLVLHGHAHILHMDTLPVKNGGAMVVGGGSASHAFGHGRYRPAQYNIFEIERMSEKAWSITVHVRELDGDTKQVNTVDTHRYDTSRGAFL